MELQKFLLMCSDCFWYVDFPLKTFQPHKNMLNPLRTLWKKILIIKWNCKDARPYKGC